ncbi:MAG: immunoglobulin domain-containing protein [Candidatus Acidiferrales bacterium]
MPITSRSRNRAFAIFLSTVFLAVSTLLSACVGSSKGGDPGGSVAPEITAQPQSMSVPAGKPATFSVTAGGSAPLTYQWLRGTTKVGTNSPTFTLATTSASDNNAKFQVMVSNSLGSKTSAAATLTVTAAPTKPSITTQPASTAVTVGQTATFTVVATGTAPLSYQWMKGTTKVGSNSANYTTPATTAADNNTKFQVVVSNTEGSATSAMATLTVNAAASKPVITTQPKGTSVTVGQTATFTVIATGAAPLSYQWTKSGGKVGANSASYTTPATTIADNGAQIQVTVSNTAGSTPSSTVSLTVTNNVPPPPGTVNILTYHNDVGRTGQNLSETILTHANVKSATFGVVGSLPADGRVDAEPLYVSNLKIGGVSHNVVYVVTEHDSVYAYDADTFAQLWKVSMLGAGETPSEAVNGCGQVSPEIGITSTPVIDLNAGANGTIFLVAMSKSGTTYIHRVHALDLTTGADLAGSPVTVQATFPGTGEGASGGNVIFVPKQYKDRASLLLLNGVIYTSWASHCDDDPYTGWIIGYSESSLAQTSVLNITPNGGRAAIWMAGAGLAADSTNNIYFLAGNGTFDDVLNSSGFPENGDYGNAFIKLSTAGNKLAVADYFNMFNTDSESNADTDLGSGGAMVLPDLKDNAQNTWHLAVGAGKDTNLYVVNRDMMGKFNASNDNAIYQKLSGVLPGGIWSMPAYFNGAVYYGSVNSNLQAFTITNAKLVSPASSHSAGSYGYPGTTPSISANGTSNGIVWAVENAGGGVLHAYDATNLATELYNSNQAANSRDHFSDNKYITPMIANGKVFVGTPNGVTIFGLLP